MWVCLFVAAANCGTPQVPINGRVVHYTNISEGGTVTYQCIEGYIPSTMKTSVCTNQAQWNPDTLEHNCTLVKGILLSMHAQATPCMGEMKKQ